MSLRYSLGMAACLACGLWLLAAPPLARAQTPGIKANCRWGQPHKMDAIPGCGVPRVLHVSYPRPTDRLMFARLDNPTLTRYLYRARAIGAPAKLFRRMVNVSKTDLVLCPADFRKARILSFRVMRGRVILQRPTCELGPPPRAGAMTAPAMAATPGAAVTPGKAQPGMMAGSPASAMAGSPAPAMSVSEAIERKHPVMQADLIKLRRALKMDSVARLLGLLGLLLGLGATVGVLLLALTLRRRVSRLEEELEISQARGDD